MDELDWERATGNSQFTATRSHTHARLPGEHVGIVCPREGLLQLLQLETGECGSIATLLALGKPIVVGRVVSMVGVHARVVEVACAQRVVWVLLVVGARRSLQGQTQ